MSGSTFTFTRTGGTNKTINLTPQRIDVPNGAKLIFYNSSAPCGYTKVSSNSLNNAALRVVTGTGSGTGGNKGFSNVFAAGKSDGASVSKGNLDVGGSVNAAFASGFSINRGNLNLQGNPTGNFSSGFSINIGGSPDRGNMSVAQHTVSWNQMPSHAHNYQRATHNGRADSDDSSVSRGNSNAATGNSGNSGAHRHNISGQPNKGNLSAGYNGNVSVGKGNLAVGGNPQYNGGVSTSGASQLNLSGNPTLSAGSIDLDVKYVDVIIATRNTSAPGQCNINAGD